MDLQAPETGEESALNQIIKEYFEKFEWENARDSLQNYLSLPRSGDIQARARFYLGQTHYFTGNYREALWEFLFFRSINPPEANRWIDAVLAAMVN
jgi:TolA-binding protein